LYREMWKIVLDERDGDIDALRVCRKVRRFFSVNGDPINFDEEGNAFGALAELASQGLEISRRLLVWAEQIPQNIPAI
ncbi:MAG: hypothetical protein GTN81_13575, partial [Proteobacteria bacterium]|nr:hypothetical protein [Pseudomonadota bacterium]